MSAEVTVVHVPRERYGETRNSLESILQNTGDVPHELLILDAASPPDVARYLRTTADAAPDRRLVRFEYILTPNELRNRAIGMVDTPYVAFVDNDAVVSPGWLGPLVAAAKEQDAWVVGPTMLIGQLDDGVIHLAGGDCHIEEEGGSRHFSFLQQHFSGRRLSDVGDQLEPGPCTCIEFHCMLVRRDVFDALGPLDEGLMSFVECDDFSMKVVEAGGRIYHAPESVVTYLPPRGKLRREDVEFFLLRWSDEWNRRSLETFAEKWRLAPDDPWIRHARQWPKAHRRHVLKRLAWPLGRISGIIQYRLWFSLGDRLASWLETRYMRRVYRARVEGLRSAPDVRTA